MVQSHELTPEGSKTTVYYLAWRARRNHPWRSEEFESRFEAHNRYLSLLERGVEAYLETRRRCATV